MKKIVTIVVLICMLSLVLSGCGTHRIIIHERTAKHSKTTTQQIDIYFPYIGKLAPEQVA